jgi:toxin-antitoxin system PIN domain toxin
MTYLLDVNVLIGLLDREHLFHEAAQSWFMSEGAHGWATCPLTENAVLRILGDARYPIGPGTPAAAAQLLAEMRGYGAHAFWSDEISLLDAPGLDLKSILRAADVTDTYLLALAAHRGGRLATFDRRLSTVAVAGGAEALQLIA